MRSNHEDYNPPFVFYTGDRVGTFFELISKNTIQDFAVKLEAYCISGVDGTYIPFAVVCAGGLNFDQQVSRATPSRRPSSSSTK